MQRMALAVLAALGLHALLLMIVLPDLQVINPEIKGSGQVTVSIVHSSFVVEKAVDNAVEEQETEELVEYPEEVLPEVVEDITPPQTIASEVPEAVISKEQVPPDIPVTVHENLEKTDSVTEDDPDAIAETKNAAKTKHQEASAAFSETEMLESPEPIGHRNNPPEYPSLARKRGWEGTVILEVDIQSNGMVKDIQVKQSSSFALLDREALNTVRKWQFQPGSRAGKFVDMKVLVPVHFLLQEQ